MPASDLRGLVLDASLAQALRTIDTVRDQNLHVGAFSDTLEVDGVEWHITTSYDRNTAAAMVEGHPVAEHAHGLPPGLAALFGAGTDAGKFSWMAPAAWLEAAGGRAGLRA